MSQQTYYKVIIKKQGYITYVDDHFLVPDNTTSIQRVFLLTYYYKLLTNKNSIDVYPGTGNLFILRMNIGPEFENEVTISVEADSVFEARLTNTKLSRQQTITELTILADSTFQIRPVMDSYDPNILVISTYQGIPDTLMLMAGMAQWYPFDDLKSFIESQMHPYWGWLEEIHPELEIETEKEWIILDNCPGCVGATDFSFLGEKWEISIYVGTFSQVSTIEIRRRNSLEIILEAQKQQDGIIHEI